MQEVQNGQVFSCLGHYAFIGGDHEQGHVYSPDTGQHVLDEALMSWDINDAYLSAAGEGEPSEAEINCHASLLLLRKPIRVYPSEGVNKHRLTVVYMSCSTNDKHDVVRLRFG